MDTTVSDTKVLNYQISPFITNLSLAEDELISTITTYKSNVYIGTTLGTILHYHHFDDVPEYILISQLQISDTIPITKILILPITQRVVILSGRIAQIYSLPELSPCHIKRMKDINDIQLLQNDQTDSILILSHNKVRIVKLQGDQIKIVREIHYSNAITGNSFKPNPANLTVIADTSNYDIIDIDNNRKIPLFEYRTGEEIIPILTSFYAQDTKQSELLLTISSDSTTAIAMFINTSGDVTRGTLTWIGQGYPNGGVVIEWPYVLGIFNSEGKSKLILSSLETLDSVINMNLTDFRQSESVGENESIETRYNFSIMKLTNNLSIEDVSIKHLVSIQEPSGIVIQPVSRITTDILVHNGKQIWSIHKTNPVLEIHNQFLNSLETYNEEFLKADVNHLTEESKNYAIHLQFLLALHLKQPDLALKFALKQYLTGPIISPNLVLYLVADQPKPSVFAGLEQVLANWKFETDLDFMKRYVTELPSQYWTGNLRQVYYTNCNELEILNFFEKDPFWGSYTDVNKQLIELFSSRSIPTAMIKAYESLFEYDTVNRSHIASLYSTILSENLTSDTVNSAIKLLSSTLLSDKDYGKLLVELIRVDKDQGVTFMRSKTAKRYNEINRAITKELSDSSKGFAILSIELLQSSFLEDLQNQEIFDELIDMICTTMISYDVETSFDLLLCEYEAINFLEKDKWPKISWLDFVNISGKSKDSEMFFELYLKSFELFWVKHHKSKEFTIPDHKIFQYHKFISNPNISDLLEFHDYSTAETVALTGEVSLPNHKFFFQDYTPEKKQNKDTHESLLTIFKYYLELYEQGKKVEPAIQHFVETYNTQISPVELLEIIPNSFPLVYLMKFLEQSLVDLKSTSRETHIRKVITKSESSRIKQLYKDFLTV